VPPKIVSDAAVRVEPGSQVSCSATGTPPIYIALIRNFTVVMNTTNIASSKLYQEGNYTCVATNKYGTDVKGFVIKGGEKIIYFEINPMVRVARGAGGGGPIMRHAEVFYQITHHGEFFHKPRIMSKEVSLSS